MHKYPPVHNSGAEHYLAALLGWLRARGHEVEVAARDAGRDYEWRGVRVRALKGGRLPELEQAYRDCDVAITHLDLTRGAMVEAQRAGKPLVHLVHNEKSLGFWNVTRSKAALVAYNSHWVRRRVEVDQGQTLLADRSVVVLPYVCTGDYYAGRTGDALTLINLSENKGATTVWGLAHLLPHERFIGVLGSYHDQLLPPEGLSNVEVRPNTEDILSVYRDTRVLLMPSLYESFGRTALEAASSGIPTIAHPTPGLLEAMGSAAIFADRMQPTAWRDWVRRLRDQPDFRAEMSESAWLRAGAMERRSRADMLELEQRMMAL